MVETRIICPNTKSIQFCYPWSYAHTLINLSIFEIVLIIVQGSSSFIELQYTDAVIARLAIPFNSPRVFVSLAIVSMHFPAAQCSGVDHSLRYIIFEIVLFFMVGYHYSLLTPKLLLDFSITCALQFAWNFNQSFSFSSL